MSVEEEFDPAETFDGHAAILAQREAAEAYGSGALLDAINGLPDARGLNALTAITWSPKISKVRDTDRIVWTHTWRCQYGIVRASQVTGRPLLGHVGAAMRRARANNDRVAVWRRDEEERRAAAVAAGIPLGFGLNLDEELRELGVALVTAVSNVAVAVSIRVSGMNYYTTVPHDQWEFFTENLPQLFWHMSEGASVVQQERD